LKCRAFPKASLKNDGNKNGKLVLQILPFIADRSDRNSFDSLNEPIPIGGFSITLAAGLEIERILNPITAQELKFRKTAQGVRFRPKPVRKHTLLVLEPGFVMEP